MGLLGWEWSREDEEWARMAYDGSRADPFVGTN